MGESVPAVQDFVPRRLAILGLHLLPAPLGHPTFELSLLPAPRRHAMKTSSSTSGKAGVSTICSAIRRRILLSRMCSTTLKCQRTARRSAAGLCLGTREMAPLPTALFYHPRHSKIKKLILGENLKTHFSTTNVTKIITELLPEKSKSVSVTKKSSGAQICICIQK